MKKDGMTIMAATQAMVHNFVTDRVAWLRKLMDPRRNIEAECGHPDQISTEDYVKAFKRGDVASRVVSVWPDESWSENPLVYENEDEGETKFETEWKELEEQLRLFSLLQRADTLSGIGRFGIILLGFGDGKKLEEPVIAQAGMKLLYIRTFDESLITIKSFETDVTNARYGQPKTYEIKFTESDETGKGTTVSSGSPSTSLPTTQLTVHWSRIIHLADNRMDSEVYGRPRLEKVMNRVLDAKKIAGGSGEMFWKGGFPGLSLETHPSETPVEIDVESTKQQIDQYQNGLSRYLTLNGMQAKNLGTQVADPTPHVEMQIRLIAMTVGVPWRVFMGSEAAQLASEQDTRAWHRRLKRRRHEYVTPFVIRPLVDRLIEFQVLTKPTKVFVFWPDLNTPSDKEKSEVALKRSEALEKYVTSGADVMMPPFHYLTLVQGYSDEEARAILDEAGDNVIATDPKNVGPQPAPKPAPAAAAKTPPK